MGKWAAVAILVVVVAACSRPTRPVQVKNRYPESVMLRHERQKQTQQEPSRDSARSSHHLVQRGETLYGIAFDHGLDFKTLARWNNIDTDFTIYPGQKLILTGPAPTASPVKAKPKVAKIVVTSPDSASRNSGKPASGNSASKPEKVAVKPQKPIVSKTPAKPATTVTGNAGIQWRWPVKGSILSRFANETPGRQGIRIGGNKGAAIDAAAAGKVVYSGNGLKAYGELIIIKHNNSYISAYAHNSKRLVQEGDSVGAGQKIAEMGERNGEMALHFEIRKNGKPTNPLSYLPAP